MAALVIKMLFMMGVLVLSGGTAMAISQPESALAAPFRKPAIAVMETTSNVAALFQQTRGVAANQETAIISTTIQAMRTTEGLTSLDPVTESTNNMSAFPSPLHPLYPDYLQNRESQFKYTLDVKGVVHIDPASITSESLADRITKTLEELKQLEAR